MAPKRPQNDPNTVPKSCLFHLRFMLRFWVVFYSILTPFGEPFGPQNRLKIHLDFLQNITCCNISPKTIPRGPKTSPRGPQVAPRGPPDPPKRLQEEPKKPQKESKRPQDAAPNDPQNIRRGPRTSEQQKCRTNFNTEYESRSGGMREAIRNSKPPCSQPLHRSTSL